MACTILMAREILQEQRITNDTHLPNIRWWWRFHFILCLLSNNLFSRAIIVNNPPDIEVTYYGYCINPSMVLVEEWSTVAPCTLKKNFYPSRMVVKEGCNVVYIAVVHRPAIML